MLAMPMVATSLPWTEPSLPSTVAFLAVVFGVVALFLGAVAVASGPAARTRNVGLAALGVAGWMALQAAATPFTLGWIPVSLFAFFFATNGTVLALALSPLGRWLAAGVPLIALVAFPGFRFPLELVLHSWAEQGVIPVSMTWSGQNLDIVAGVFGPACALGMWAVPGRARAFAWLGNTVCFAFLLNVMRVAMQSSPGPQRIFGDPPLLLAAHVPAVWIVSICVAGALLGHLVTFRKLLTER